VKSVVRAFLVIALLAWAAPGARAEMGELKLEIQTPTSQSVLPSTQTWVEVEGGASTIGGVRELDLFFVMDTSSSLRSSDPDDARTAGAIGLVESLPLDRSGSTDLAAGMRKALAGFQKGARPGSSRVMLVFSDGEAKSRKAKAAIRKAAGQASGQGVAVHALSLGSSAKGGATLSEIAQATGGSFVRVTDPASLPEAFLELRTTGVDHVTVAVNDSAPVTARLRGSTFSARVPVTPGENRIVATATSLHGQTRSESVHLSVRDPAERRSAGALDLGSRRRDRLRRVAEHVGADGGSAEDGRRQGDPRRRPHLDAPRPERVAACLRPPAPQ
jgi:hypothetical protein